MRLLALLLFFLLPGLSWPHLAQARELESVPNPMELQSRQAFVWDEPSLLNPAERDELDSLGLGLAHTGEAEMVFVLLSTIGDKDPAAFVSGLLKRWGLDQGKSLLLLLVHDQRRVEVAVGEGLRSSLTEIRVQQVLRNELVTQLKTGRYGPGMLNAARAFERTIRRGAPGQTLSFVAYVKERAEVFALADLIPFLLLGFLVARIFWARSKKRGHERLKAVADAFLLFGLPALVITAVRVGLGRSSWLAGSLVFLGGGMLMAGVWQAAKKRVME